MSRRNNFNIDNYIHLSAQGAFDDSSTRSSGQADIFALLKSKENELEGIFKNSMGVSSREFMDVVGAKAENFNILLEFFNSSEIKDLENNEEFARLMDENRGLFKSKSLGEINKVLIAYYAGDSSTNTKEVENFIMKNTSADFNRMMTEAVSDKIMQKKDAEFAILTEAILKNAKSDGGKISSEVEIEAKTFQELDNQLKELVSTLSRGFKFTKGVRAYREVNKMKELLNEGLAKDLKKIAEENKRKMLDEDMIEKMIEEGLTTSKRLDRLEKNEEVSIKRASRIASMEQRKRTAGDPDISPLAISMDGGRLVDAIQIISEELASQTFQIDGKVTFKEAPNKSKAVGDVIKPGKIDDFDKLFSKRKFSVLELVTFMNIYGGGMGNKYVTGTDASAFLNALNFYILGSSYNNDERTGMPKKEGGYNFGSLSSVDQHFNNILGQFLIESFVSIINPGRILFLRVGDDIFPTPVIFRELVRRFKEDSGSYMMEFSNIGSSRAKAVGVLNSSRVGVYNNEGAKGKGQPFHVAATYRNWDLQTVFLSQEVTVNKEVLNMDDIRSILYK